MFLRASSVPYASDNAALPTEVRHADSNAVSTPSARRQHAVSTPSARRQRAASAHECGNSAAPRDEFCVKAIVRGTRGHVWRCLLTQCVPAGADVQADTHGAGVQGRQRRPHRYTPASPALAPCVYSKVGAPPLVFNRGCVVHSPSVYRRVTLVAQGMWQACPGGRHLPFNSSRTSSGEEKGGACSRLDAELT